MKRKHRQAPGVNMGLRSVTISDSYVDFRPNALPLIGLFIVTAMMMGPVLSGIFGNADLPAAEIPWSRWAIAVAAAPLLIAVVLRVFWGKTLRIDRNGVKQTYLFQTRQLLWREVRDLGVSYDGLGCGRLYFADERLQTNGSGKKLLMGKHCSIHLRRRDLDKVPAILRTCRNYTRVRPFLCSEEERLTGKISWRQ